MKFSLFSLGLSGLFSLGASLTISQINGPAHRSPYENKDVKDVTGLVTAIGPSGFFLRDTTPDGPTQSSNSVYVFTSSSTTIRGNITVGDAITIDGRILEYRSDRAYLFLTEISAPKNLRKVSSGNRVEPVVLGKERSPPTCRYSAIDEKAGGVFAVPNNQSLYSVVNATVEQDKYGLDFWESLSGELVKIPGPVALSKPSNFGDVWVHGEWRVTGKNSRGGLTIVPGSPGADANPEAIRIGSPLDSTKNEATKLGDKLEEITGVVTYAFGFYTVLPLTALKVKSSAEPAVPPPASLKSSSRCSGLTFGCYNIENLALSSAHLPKVADHIVNFMGIPDFMFLQEVQDDDGPNNSGNVSSNQTLAALSAAVKERSGVSYEFAVIDPVDGKDGGQPGGNIRVAYFYNPEFFTLRNPNPGSSTDATEVLPGPELSFNPGRIDPANAAWTNSRKPLAAVFDTKGGDKVFVINVHFASKGGSSSIQGDARPPVNGGVEDRQAQAESVTSFVSKILAQDRGAKVIIAGDFNEFTYISPMRAFDKIAYDLDIVTEIPVEERYTYLFDMNSQQLDHMLVSYEITQRDPEYEHVHVNTWTTREGEVSDHDPSVAKLNVCK
ncbi:DNase I-like protein [Choiromyces venosus 120613-1]|uniref:DNase I-like protein n=1 Tax=Choiromyces venosus 120613-1 TaxID=1336337 RepID=A0A3N4K6K6_9PEZI|nr:DNase I-like protein [Choiromyces venosus 120613-1]